MSNSPTVPRGTGSPRHSTPLTVALGNTEGEGPLQAALAASARAVATSNGLCRAIEDSGTGTAGVREASQALGLELEGLRELLGSASERQLRIEQSLLELERVLERTREEQAQERAFLIQQQDAFLRRSLDEQEVELERRDAALEILRDRVAELERRQLVTMPPAFSLEAAPHELLEAPSDDAGTGLDRAERVELERTAHKLAEDRERARETVARLQGQRDDAQLAVARITKERDEALQQVQQLRSELGGPRLPLSTLPAPPDSGSEPRLNGPAGFALDQLQIEARLNRPTLPPALAAGTAARSSAANEEVEGPPSISSVLDPPPSDPHSAPLSGRLSPLPGWPSAVPSRTSQPPPEPRLALTGAPMISASSSPPLKQKPDASTRPLVGYSIGSESVEAEYVEGIHGPSKPAPPGSSKR